MDTEDGKPTQTGGDGGMSRKKRRMEWWKKHKSDKKGNTNDDGFPEVKTETNGDGAEGGAGSDKKPKLRNRGSIAKPDSLKYEPNYTKGFHAKILQNLYVDSPKKKKKKIPDSTESSQAQKRKSLDSSTSPTSDKSQKLKSPEVPLEPVQTFDSYTFSLGLINGNVDIPKAAPSKEEKKYVLFIGNLPYDVTREQLEEHFRKTGGIKSIRIPREKGSDMGKGFAYMEFDGRISHGIALRLHQTTLGGRKINVEFTSIGGGNSDKRREKLKQKNMKRKNMKRH